MNGQQERANMQSRAVERAEYVARLKAKIADYKPHKCYNDEHEDGCPVCGDIDQMEHELSLLEP